MYANLHHRAITYMPPPNRSRGKQGMYRPLVIASIDEWLKAA